MPPVNVLLSGLPFGAPTVCLRVGDEARPLIASQISDAVVATTGLPRASFFLRTHRALLQPHHPVTTPGQHTTFVALCLRRALPGGKGGFGAMLRGAAASKKTTNFDACRDLSGRRLRHVRDEAAVRRFLQRRAEEPAPRAAAAAAAATDAAVRPATPHVPRKRRREARTEGAAKADAAEVAGEIERIGQSVSDAVAEAIKARRKRPKGGAGATVVAVKAATVVAAAAEASASVSVSAGGRQVAQADWMLDYDGVSSSDSEASEGGARVTCGTVSATTEADPSAR